MRASPTLPMHHWLAPITPELLVTVDPEQGPVIADAAPQVVAWTGRRKHDLIGQPVAETFGRLMPDLNMIVTQVYQAALPIRDYRLTFHDAAGIKRTLALHAGLIPTATPHRPRTIAVRFEEISTPKRLENQDGNVEEFHGMIGRSDALRKVFRRIEVYGPTDAPVLITGETGTGKELAARALHACSRRHRHPFLAVNCAALSEELLESELFGHERGAFTGALRVHKGRFERANGGTLFLDEIGEMPFRLQAKLLRVLETGTLERVGGEQEISFDVRFEAATNVPLELAIQAGTFRPDLYHRLAVLRLHMPPLRERLDDFPMLVTQLLQLLNRKYQRGMRRLTSEALRLLTTYTWPGNVRELRNVLERVYVESTTEIIDVAAFEEWLYERTQYFPGAAPAPPQEAFASPSALHMPFSRPYYALPPGRPMGVPVSPPAIDIDPTAFTYLDSTPGPPRAPAAQSSGSQDLTLRHLVQAYRQAEGNIAEAARLLGVHRATLYRHMKSLGVTRNDLEQSSPAQTRKID